MSADPGSGTDAAIVGMAAVFPGAADATAYWQNIVDGVDAITDAPASRIDPAYFDPDSWDRPSADRFYTRRGGFVDTRTQFFDPARFGVMPLAVNTAEPDQLIALQIAAQALDDAGGLELLPDRERIGVVLGRGGYIGPGMHRENQRIQTSRQLTTVLADLLPEIGRDRIEQVRKAFVSALGPELRQATIGIVPNLAASRIANRLDLRGPAYTVDAACASSLVAVDHAMRELASGRCDLMLAGGVHHAHDVLLWSLFCQLRALSRSACIRPFDRRADGVLVGEGTGIVVLKRLADAQRDGDRVYAVIRGSGVASDGRATSLMAPHPDGQILAMSRAWKSAGLDPTRPGAIGLVEAHGTATPVGDAAEITTLRTVLGDDPHSGEVGLGSVKSMIGHAMPAAGAAGLIKAAFALHHRVLPPTLHAEQGHEALDGSRLRLVGAARPWEVDRPAEHPRRAGVNAFGFGGINAHLLLEQAPESSPVALPLQASRDRAADPTEPLLRLAAADPSGLALLLERPDSELLAGGSHGGDGPCRLALVAPTTRSLALARAVVTRGTPWRGRQDLWFTASPLLGTHAAAPGRIAFVYPGIEAGFAPRSADIAARFQLPGLAESGHEGLYGQAVGVHTLGQLLTDALDRLGIRPDVTAGHSVGEWGAMGAAGLLPRHDAAAFLDNLTQHDTITVAGTVFAALGCGAERAEAALTALFGADRSHAVVSHDNCPHQSIVCGEDEAVSLLLARLAAEHVHGQVLPFRSGFHSPMLLPHLEPIRPAIAATRLTPPVIPVWSATLAAPFPDDPYLVREVMLRHLLEPVRFREVVQGLYSEGVRAFVQLGTGSTLGFIRDTLAPPVPVSATDDQSPAQPYVAVAAVSETEPGLGRLLRVAAALWAEGAEPDFAPLLPPGPGTQRRRAPLPPLRLDLGTPLIHLEGITLSPPPVDEVPQPAPARQGTPLLAELDALLREASESAVAVFTAQAAPRTTGPTPAPVGPTEHRSRRTFSVDEQPYLLDHCLHRQPEGWPDAADRFPVVPMTALLEIMAEEALRLVPGRVVLGYAGVRALTWLLAAPASTVDVHARHEGRDDRGRERVRVVLDGYAYGTVLLGAAHPAAPAPDTEPLGAVTAAGVPAARVYADHWMFHGPGYQGITAVGPVAADGMTATLTVPTAPGALLDNAGQVLGLWLMQSVPADRLAFPSTIDTLSLYGPPPRPGERLACTVRIRELTAKSVRADLELCTEDGRLWARAGGWEDYRFRSDDVTSPFHRDPGRRTLAQRQPGGWFLARERWDAAGRELTMRGYLNRQEREEYEQLTPRARTPWLLARMAVKDAVRSHLWEAGAGPVHPVEITVGHHPDGRPLVHGPVLDAWLGGPPEVSLAHTGGSAPLGAALVRAAGPGIDIERADPRDPAFEADAFTDSERDLLDLLAAAEGRPLATARLWTAKEAAAKAAGTGLRGRPRDFVVRQRTEGGFDVQHDDSTRVVRSVALDGGTHVAAWT